MESSADTEALTALGHPGRLAVFRLLARRAPQGVRPGEIAEALAMKPNTLSVYVGALARAGLVASWRDGRQVFYGIDLDRVGALVDFLVNDCCRGRPELCEPLAARSLRRLRGGDGAPRVLFVCTGNSARSIFAEAIVRHEARGRLMPASAGTHPAARIHPEAAAVLREEGYATDDLSPKSLDAIAGPRAPAFDLVITVCNEAANEDCPPLPGLPVSAHWGLPDPAAACGDAAARRAAFRDAFHAVRVRVRALMALPLKRFDALALQAEIDAIGRTPVAQATV